ncbi:hypothetical protein [Gordonia soli]|nr:hypothetical protein [Gordonia soli]
MQRVFLHLGLPKTGTTNLQDRLWRNRDTALADFGLLYPGNLISDHFHAAVHLQPDRYLDWVDPAFAGSWPTMLAQMKNWPQTSLVSHELFSTATPETVDRILADLSFADEVHVIATVRDLARQLASVWQENVKNQRVATFGEFVSSVRAHAGPPGDGSLTPGSEGRLLPEAIEEEPFWEFQDHVRILRTWSERLGAARVHVVTVPARGTDGSLWDRFLSVLEVDGAALTAQVPGTNSSLSAAQAEFLRLLNRRLGPDQIPWERYERVVKGQLVGEILFRSQEGVPQGLSADQRVWVSAHAAAMTGSIRSAGYRVGGDLDDLTVSRVTGPDAKPPTGQAVLDVALDTLSEMVRSAPLPRTRPRWQTEAKNVARRIRRRALSLRTRRTAH